MKSERKTESAGFAPRTHTCPYHTWKPAGVSWGCTCFPAPTQQVNWEKTIFDCGEGGVLCQAPIRPGDGSTRRFLGGADTRRMAIFCRMSTNRFLSVLQRAKKAVAGRFIRVCDVVRSKQSCQTEP